MASTVTTAPDRPSAPSRVCTAYLIGLVVAVEMRQHQRRIGSKGAEHVRGATVEKVIEAAPQGLAVDRHVTLALDRGGIVQRGGMATKRRLHRSGVKLPQDAADRRVGWRFPPPQ